MRVAIAHNRYQQAGGEDKVVAAEAAMLRRRGHEVEMLGFDNEAIVGAPGMAFAAAKSFFSPTAYKQVGTSLASFRPDVLHVHNFLPTLSPAVFFAAEKAGVPVVQTLHNYRLICANAQLFRDGHTCELCLEKRSFLPGVRRACYRGSRAGSAVVGGTVALHAGLGTWDRRVTRYIALSHFAAQKLGTFRIPAAKIRIKPNFVPDAGTGEGAGGYALFVGRLSREKGLDTLLAADCLGELAMPALIVGDGPMREAVERACARVGSRLVYLGPKAESEVRVLMEGAVVLLVPSLWYEGFPMVMVEALSLGLPVVASRIGGLPEIVEDNVSGLLSPAGDAQGLLDCLKLLQRMEATQMRAMRNAARSRYLEFYGEEANYAKLVEIYAEAIAAGHAN